MDFIKNNKKIITYTIISIFLLSALIYNFLYNKNEKNEIIDEFETENLEEEIQEEKTIFIDIGGEVVIPGMYELPENSRVNDAIKIAGGVTDEADISDVNLAYILADAMKLTIPKAETKKEATNENKTKEIVSKSLFVAEKSEESSGKVNINTATKDMLKTLSGIGDATAQKIIDYRSENGRFENIDAIKNVSGIGDSKFEKIKEKITV